MHYWGDEWFQKNGDDFYKAIKILEERMKNGDTSMFMVKKNMEHTGTSISHSGMVVFIVRKL